MRKIKFCLLIICSIILSGCSVNYTITIDEENFAEKININDFITSTRTIDQITTNYQDYYPTTVEGVADLESLICEKIDECYVKNLALQSNTGYIYNLTNTNSLNNLGKTTSWLFLNDVKSFLNDENNIIISTGNGLKYFDLSADLTEISITLVTDLNVTKNNADKINGNSYTWIFNRENYLTKNIFINIAKKDETNIDNEEQNSENEVEEDNEAINEEKENNYAIYIIIAILFVYLLIIRLIIKKKR